MINVAWDHNSYYHERLLRALPARCGRVLDVGCGAGRFAARLAERADQVDALDRSPAMIAEARRIVPANVTCLLGEAATADLPAGAYDAVTSISALHHMDLPAVLPRLAAALRPGGLLIAVSHHRLEIPRGLPAEAVSVFGNNARRAVLLCLPAGRRYRREMYQRHATHSSMPVKDPQLTLRQVRAQAAAALPGSRVRWLVHWRYELTWRKPAETPCDRFHKLLPRRRWRAACLFSAGVPEKKSSAQETASHGPAVGPLRRLRSKPSSAADRARVRRLRCVPDLRGHSGVTAVLAAKAGAQHASAGSS